MVFSLWLGKDKRVYSNIGWADEGSLSVAIDGLRTSAHPIVLAVWGHVFAKKRQSTLHRSTITV